MTRRRPPERAGVPEPCARLRYRGRELVLTPGEYVFGRSAACAVVLDQPLVSRRHAKVTVSASGVTVSDLGSSNGVYVDGERLGPTPRPLKSGNRIVIGGQEFVVQIDGSEVEERDTSTTQRGVDGEQLLKQQGSATAAPRGARKPRPAPEPEPIDAAEESTSRTGGLKIMAIVAESALAGGRPKQAEDVMLKHLYELADEIKSGRKLPPTIRETGLYWALKLASSLGKSSWLDYAVDLLASEPTLLDDERANDLKRVFASVRGMDVRRLERYAQAVKKLQTSYDRIRTLQHIDELIRLAKSG